MAEWLVLQRYEGLHSGHRIEVRPGEVIDDTHIPVAAMIANGCSAISYNAVTMAAVAAAYNEEFGRESPPDQGMSEALISYGLISTAGAPASGAGNPNGVTTGARGQMYYDTTAGLWYACTSTPSGTVWVSL